MDYKNKYLKYKNKYLTLKKLQNGGSYGFVISSEIKDILDFKNTDLRDTLNQPAVAALLNGSMPQPDVNKHLLTATVTIFNRIREKRNSKTEDNVNQTGGSYGYVMNSEIKDISDFKNIDVRDTLNQPALAALLNGSMPQSDVNKHLLTAIVTVFNLVKDVKSQTGFNLVKDVKFQTGGGFVMGSEIKDISEFKNVDVRDTLNQPALAAILNDSMPQPDVNKHLLTAIVTVNNKINQ
tara:strand:- start:1503 stop:2213 length:711 start_codon:yes stop_codon:yes gene_type:complete